MVVHSCTCKHEARNHVHARGFMRVCVNKHTTGTIEEVPSVAQMASAWARTPRGSTHKHGLCICACKTVHAFYCCAVLGAWRAQPCMVTCLCETRVRVCGCVQVHKYNTDACAHFCVYRTFGFCTCALVQVCDCVFWQGVLRGGEIVRIPHKIKYVLGVL